MGVWDYATKRKNPVTKELEGQCNTCSKIIKCSGNSTTTLKKHLLVVHAINVDAISQQKESDLNPSQEKKQKTLPGYFAPKRQLKDIISDLATDNISIRAITRNKYIREAITKDGFKLPANESDVMKLLHNDFDDKRQKLMELFKEKLENGSKFSMSVDEVTTVRGRRFFGINIHDHEGKTFKTGLVRILGSCNAEQQLELIENHLNTFGIFMDRHILASTQDGASVNKKYIRIGIVEGQFCINHGLHLGVCDTLYTIRAKTDQMECEQNNEDSFDNVDFEVINDECDQVVDFHETLKRCREITKFIKGSTVKNHVFQTKVKENHHKEIELHLDVKTRWNSIPSMLTPLLKTEIEIRATLEEFKANELLENFSFESIKTLQAALEPVKIAVENLSKEDSTLLTADIVLKFMFEKLSKLDSDVSKKLKENLERRVDERLNCNLMSVVRCLQDPNVSPTKDVISFASKLMTRLFGSTENENPQAELPNQPNDEENFSLQQELTALLANSQSITPKAKQDNSKWLKTEFSLFKNTGQRTENLQKLYNAFLTIKPTSTDVERVFSVTNSFCTKIRSRLSDKSLNALVFLKYYYNKNSKI